MPFRVFAGPLLLGTQIYKIVFSAHTVAWIICEQVRYWLSTAFKFSFVLKSNHFFKLMSFSGDPYIFFFVAYFNSRYAKKSLN